ncbi:MC005L [Molluscum contagiosum virus subtype 1]|mgnify:FL=1|uniref:Protein MC005 n=2 Tax=Molluscum contagiosum virus TaxID=10279 RepID=MC005_MCV1|nr:MC005L [Molluscum contagiosum virus subtype 1]Q98176.1 RecName: Full=Protein MC005 [Molluscum contagiosum virus subtype 1]AZT86340.1 MC005L [Molluscum contagiosum virus]AAC55133.1 MC005L [Molluscum contagiosum virus subtype 1]AQY16743.1 MC005 [Molluscum contagiosum virus subtype 1]AQY17103.1 MC005 [Molluscum contagiosum virus subtype 1]AYO88668.1 MC005 [Molluscum contagiosum virus subtype 1]
MCLVAPMQCGCASCVRILDALLSAMEALVQMRLLSEEEKTSCASQFLELAIFAVENCRGGRQALLQARGEPASLGEVAGKGPAAD